MKKWTIAMAAAVVAFGTGTSEAKAFHVQQQMQIVASFYPKYLQRGPDNSGMKYWRNELLKGVPVQEIEARLLASPEYYFINGNCNPGFINGLVRDVFGGPICPIQVAHWTARLNACGCRVTVAREALAQAAFGHGPATFPAQQPQVIIPPKTHFGHGVGHQHAGHHHGGNTIVVPPAQHGGYNGYQGHGFAAPNGNNYYSPLGNGGFGQGPVVVPGSPNFFNTAGQPGTKFQIRFGN